MKGIILVPHQGWADFFSMNGIINYHCEEYDEVIVLVLDESRRIFVSEMFKFEQKIKVQIAPLTTFCFETEETDVYTHMSHSKPPEGSLNNYRKIDFSKFDSSFERKGLGAFSKYSEWSKFRDESGLSFSHAFYAYHNIPMERRVSSFKITRNYAVEERNYELFVEKIKTRDYIIIHEDVSRGLLVDRNNIENKELRIHNLNQTSVVMIDQILIILNAKEVHLIESSYSVMLYFLSLTDENFKSKKIYLNIKNRGDRDLRIYHNPTPEKWIFS